MTTTTATAAPTTTVRDRLTGLGFVYYATPPSVLAGVLLLAAAAFAARRRWRLAASVAIAVLLCIAWHRGHAFVSPPARGGAPDVKIATWNAARGMSGWGKAAVYIRELGADVTALQEAGTDEPEQRTFWGNWLPAYERAFFGSGLVLFVRGRIVASRKIDLQDDAKCALAEVEVRGRTLHVLIVDVKRLALTPRDSVFEKLDAAVAGITARPLVVLGDFNTPRDSAFFDVWRERFQHAFETAGSGHDATWPLPLPLLAIDHVWCSRDLTVLRCDQRSTSLSDHTPVVVELLVPAR